MMAAPTRLEGGAGNTKTFKCCNQDWESNIAGIIEGDLQVKQPKRLWMQMTLN